DDDGRERFREHVAAAKQDPRTRDAAYLVAALGHLADRDAASAEREVQEGLRGGHDSAALFEAHLDVLLARKAPIAELQAAADRLRPLATTAGQLCSLAEAALRLGDRNAALALSARAFERDPRSARCRIDETPDPAPP
ncbi:MAG TPA: hypothetical protein VK607_19705, partial [Kofleriaceae bacterium]|nr:hypothetical protein [Kofleriaceae bacterium]